MSVYDHDKLIQRQFDGDGEAYKRWMQLRITESRAILHFAMAIISAKAVAISDAARVTPAMLISIKREEKSMDKLFVDCKECILQLADYEPTNTEAHNAKLQAERDKYTKVKSTVAVAITEIEAKIAQIDHERPPTATVTTDDTESTDYPVNVGNFKQVLRPEKLSSTASPFVLEDWQRQFREYFAASRANAAPVNVQQEIFLTFLDATLCKRIKRKLLCDTTVVTNNMDGDEDSGLQIPVNEFKVIHPSLERQLELFRMMQGKGQKWADFFHA